jgi:AcrR family transcriptional regulator
VSTASSRAAAKITGHASARSGILACVGDALPVGKRKGVHLEGRLREIIDQSALLFDRRGYNEVSMEEIAAGVGLRKPTLYHYVKSKDEILVLIHREFMELVFAKAEDPARANLEPAARLAEFIADIIELMDSHRGHVRVFFEHHRELPRAAKRMIVAERERYQAMVRSTVEAGIAAGQFRAVDSRLATLALFGMCNWAYQWYDPDGRLQPKHIAKTFADYLFHGIGAATQVAPKV